MPRKFDCDNDDKIGAYDRGAPFAELPTPRQGKNEIDLSVGNRGSATALRQKLEEQPEHA
jgi:hypothetical protein